MNVFSQQAPRGVRWTWIFYSLHVALIVMVFLTVMFLPRILFVDKSGDTESHCLDYTPSYPSAGGPGCKPKCISSKGVTNSSYGAGFYNTTHSWPEDLVKNMYRAAAILRKHGKVHSLNTERSIFLHIAFDYYCCYTPEEAVTIGEFLKAYTWTSSEVNVRFDRMMCGIHRTGNMVALVLRLDDDSQNQLLQLALESEKALEAQTGIHKRIPHSELLEFHMTLGTVNQTVFPVRTALEEINRVIPPGTWHAEPIVLHKPQCSRALCERVALSETAGSH